MTKSVSAAGLAIALTCIIAGANYAFKPPPPEQFVRQNVAWESKNKLMSEVPAEYNAGHHLVGALMSKLDQRTANNSLYLPMLAGPYATKSAIEIELNDNPEPRVIKFRFLIKDGASYKVGPYSAWQTRDYGPKYDINNYGNPMTLNLNSRVFDQQQWLQHDLESADRLSQVWDLLHTHQVIGMSQNQIRALLGPENAPPMGSENVEFYQLQASPDYSPCLIPYLELKYKDDKVVAFRIQRIEDRSP